MKCSVIVANYNHAPSLVQALQSVELQTYTNWEVIFVDDASTDESLNVFDKWLATVPDRAKYKLLKLDQNRGVGYARRMAVNKSSGAIVCSLDPDDTLAPEAIQEIMQVHRMHPEASLVFTNLFRCDDYLKNCKAGTEAGPVLHSNLLEDKVSALAAFKRSRYDLTEGYDPTLKLAEDKDIYYKLEEVGDIIYINQLLYYYRIWSKGLTYGFDNYVRSRDYQLQAIEKAVQRRKHSGLKMPTQKELQKLLAEIHLLQAEGLIYSQQLLGARFLKHIALSIAYNPTGSITRKLKALFLLSRIKRKFKRQFTY